MKAVMIIALLALCLPARGAQFTSGQRSLSQMVAWYFAESRPVALIDHRPPPGQVAIRLVHFHARRELERRVREKELAVSLNGPVDSVAEGRTHHFLPESTWKTFPVSREYWQELVRLAGSEEFLASRPRPYFLAGPTFIIEVASTTSYKLVYVICPDYLPAERDISPVLRRLITRVLEVGGVPPAEIVWGERKDVCEPTKAPPP